MAKTNLCIVGLAKLFADEVCKELASSLGMFYANIDDLLEYELEDRDRIEDVCGKEYLVKEELSVIKRACSFDDTVININYTNLNNETALAYVKNGSVLVYLRLTRERFKKEIEREGQSLNQKIIAMDLFEDRDFICGGLADIVVDCDDEETPQVLNKINEKILEYYA